jgi:RNA polymerase sigma factor (sigma-70 family)
MATAQLNGLVRHIRRMAMGNDAAGMTDVDLLKRFVSQRDEAAFAALVRRYGPLVLGVCRRVLHHQQDAEDAFQATFLVLLHKAGSVAPPELVGNWLYGVAYFTAKNAKISAARRRNREREVSEMARARAVGEEDNLVELRLLLDEELSRLPEKYRVPIVLCELHGKSRKEVAHHVGCAEGTLSRRLTRARQMLQKRFIKRGLALSSASLAVALSRGVASASVPAPLVASTIKTALLVAASPVLAAGVMSAPVAALTEGVLKTMFLTKLKTAVVVLLTTALVATGIGIAWFPAVDATPMESGALGRHQVPPQQTETDKERLQGKWTLVETLKHGKKVGVQEIPIKSHKLAIAGEEIVMHLDDGGTTNGTFELDSAKKPKQITITWLIQWRAIYKFDKDRLTICFNPDNGIRPDEFRTTADSGRVLFVYERSAEPDQSERDVKKSAESFDAVLAVAYSPDGKTLAAGGFNHSVGLFNAETGKIERVLEGSKDGFARHLAFSPDGNWLAWSGDDGLRLWETKTGKVRFHQPARDGNWPNGLGADGTLVAISNQHVAWVNWERGELSVLDMRGERKWQFKPEKVSIHSVALSPDGEMVAGGCYDRDRRVGIVQLWEAGTGKRIRDWALSRDAPGTMNSLTFSPDSERLAGIGIYKHAHVWDVKTGRELFSMSHAEKGGSGGGCIAFSPDGRTLITGTAGPIHTRPNGRTVVSEIKVWNATTGESIHSLKGDDDEGGSIYSIAFAPDGKTFAYADSYNLIIRDTKTWEKKRELIKNRR